MPRGLKLAPEDVWNDTSYVLSMKMRDPQFAGQTKERLTSRESAAFVSGIVKDQFVLWLNQHPEAGEGIAQLAIANAQERVKASQKVARKRVVSGPALPGKLADCTSQDPARAELFLVEGDSAGGSAKQARDREFQAVMPLRGKILNTWEVSAGELLASQEVHDITVAIGVEPASDDIARLRYHRVCILADADSDGQHIATLLCALFLRHFRPLVQAGHVFVAMPPLYRIDYGKQVAYALDDAERNGMLDRIRAENPRAKPVVTRFKGLGEMNPLQLRETTMAPESRRLVQLTLEAKDHADQIMDMLLAKKRASDRREWLERKGNLASTVAGEPEVAAVSLAAAARLRGHRASAAQDLHREGVPRVLDVRHPRPRAAARRRRLEARSAPHHLCDERARPVVGVEAQEVGAHGRRRDRQVPSARRLGLLRGDGADGAAVFLPLSDRRRPG